MNKQFFSFFIIVSLFLNLPLVAEQVQNSKLNKVKQSISKLKSTAKFVGGVGAALGASLLSLIISSKMHFLGHHSISKFTKAKDEIPDIIAGPLSGIATTYSLIIASQILEAKLNKQTLKKGFIDGLKQPFTIHRQISENVANSISQKNNKSEPSFKNTFFLMLASLNSGILVREFVLGLTPISPDYHGWGRKKSGDGAELWKRFGFKKDMIISTKEEISLLIVPLMLATSSGVAKGIYSLIKDKNNISKDNNHE
ncbi:hypothetical protein M1446_05570 [Candidatus Dependentiae bacterium]|nr:hypothetical protein [Candidatus Dependentiae bacterium]